jgi:hypothetical protein
MRLFREISQIGNRKVVAENAVIQDERAETADRVIGRSRQNVSPLHIPHELNGPLRVSRHSAEQVKSK